MISAPVIRATETQPRRLGPVEFAVMTVITSPADAAARAWASPQGSTAVDVSVALLDASLKPILSWNAPKSEALRPVEPLNAGGEDEGGTISVVARGSSAKLTLP